MNIYTMSANIEANAAKFTGGTRSAQAALSNFERSIDKFGKSIDLVEERLTRMGTKLTSAGRSMTAGVTVPLLGLAAAGIKTAAEFEESMNVMAAVAGVPGPELEKLRALAIQVGQDTVFSANEAAQAQVELAKAGVSTADILGGALKNAMDLAAAGGLDVANAASIMSNAMNTFNISGAESVQVADALAGAAAASSADVSDLALALAQVGLVANTSGLSIQETAAALAALADAGIRGSDAGTSLKTMLMNLQPTTKKQIALMDNLGISFVNADGSFKSLTEIAGILNTKLGGLSEATRMAALETIFGSDAVRAATALMEQGAEGMQNYIDQTSKVGTAWEQSKARMEGLPGAIERFKGSMETAALTLGTVLGPMVEEWAAKIGNLADKFTQLDPGTQQLIVNMGLLAAAAGPVMFILGSILKTLGLIAGHPVAATIIGIGAAFTYAYSESDIFRAVVTEAFGGVGSSADQAKAKAEGMVTVADRIGAAFLGMATIASTAASGVVAALQFLFGMASGMVQRYLDSMARAWGWVPGIGPKLREAAQAFEDYRDEVNAGFDSDQASILGWRDRIVKAAQDAAYGIKALDGTKATMNVDLVDLATGKVVPIQDAVMTLEASDPNVDVSATDNASAPVNNIQAALDGLASTHPNSNITVTDNATGPIGGVQGGLDRIAGTHPRPTVTLIDNASAGIRGLISLMNSLDGRTATTYVRTIRSDSGPLSNQLHTGGYVGAFHGGGQIPEFHGGGGFGDGLKSNERLAKMLVGEYVMQPSAVDNWGVGFMDYVNRKKPPRGGNSVSVPGLSTMGQTELTIIVPVSVGGREVQRTTRKATLRTGKANNTAFGEFG